MLKTQHTALVQATNQQLIQIRQNELNYYLNVCSIFGQQAALISGLWLLYPIGLAAYLIRYFFFIRVRVQFSDADLLQYFEQFPILHLRTRHFLGTPQTECSPVT
jgi:hypothetical protein